MKNNFPIFLFFAIICFFNTKTIAQPEQFIPHPDSLNQSFFGISAAMNEQYAVIGSLVNINGDFDEENSKPVYVFEKNEEGQWVIQASLKPLDYVPGEESFGWKVAISDQNVIVVSNDSHENEVSDGVWVKSGAVYVFEYENETWVQTAKLPHPNPTDINNFGHSLAIDGDYIVAGDILFEDESTYDKIGAVYVFHKEGDEWVLQAELFSPQPSDFSVFGNAVAIKGDYIIITEPYTLGDDINTGKAHIFKRNGTSWEEEIFFEVEQEAADRYYGVAVAMEDSIAIIGASPIWTSEMPGFAEILNLTETGWESGQRLWSNTGNPKDFFGYDVAIKNGKILVSAIQDSTIAPSAGKAYLFTKPEQESVLAEEIFASNGKQEAAFSYAISLSENDAVISSTTWIDSILYNNTVQEAAVGGVYFYDLSDYNVAVENPQLKGVSFQLSPNPAAKQINLILIDDHPSTSWTVKIYDSIGRMLLMKNYSKEQKVLTLDIGTLVSGLYYCKVAINGKVTSRSFIKE